MSQEFRVYSDVEASEILALAGHSTLSKNTYEVADLEKAAGELEIPKGAVAQAIQEVVSGRQDAADRREFRRKQLRPLLICLPPFAALFALMAWHEYQRGWPVTSLYGFGFILAVIQQSIYSRSWNFEKQFQEWRAGRVWRIAPDMFRDGLDPVLDHYFASFRGPARLPDLLRYMQYRFDMPKGVALESLRHFLDRRPDLASRVDLSRANVQFFERE